jgi:hypothetical protein
MKSWGFSFGMVFVVLFFMLMFSVPSQSQDKPEELVKQMTFREGLVIKDEAKLSLAKQIMADHDALKTHFQKGQFDLMSALLGKRRAVIAQREYNFIHGALSADFWKGVAADAKSLEIKTVTVYVSDVLGQFEAKEKKIFDAVAFVTLEIHAIKKTEAGAVLHNDTFICDLGYRHQDTCHWGE